MLFRSVVGALLLALLVAPAVFAQALPGDGGSGSSASAGFPVAVMVGLAAAGIAVVGTVSFLLHRR